MAGDEATGKSGMIESFWPRGRGVATKRRTSSASGINWDAYQSCSACPLRLEGTDGAGISDSLR